MGIRTANLFPDFIPLTNTLSLQFVHHKKFSQAPLENKDWILFNISGAFSTTLYCVLDKNIKSDLLGAFVEGLNIILGKTITELENQTGLLLDLSAPEKIDGFIHDVSSKNIVQYNLSTPEGDYSCSIYSDLQQQIDLKIRTAPVTHKKQGELNA